MGTIDVDEDGVGPSVAPPPPAHGGVPQAVSANATPIVATVAESRVPARNPARRVGVGVLMGAPSARQAARRAARRMARPSAVGSASV
ncbi:hypothetical protein GCM10009806_12850 [Microbacterium flavum]